MLHIRWVLQLSSVELSTRILQNENIEQYLDSYI